MDDCIFCKIVRREIDSYPVYEDSDFLAFLDIFPVSRGHVQVIPKAHYRWVWDVPNIGRYFEVCRMIARAQQKAFGIELVQCFTYGEEVTHAHVWIIPQTGGELIHSAARVAFRTEEAPQLAEQIKKHL